MNGTLFQEAWGEHEALLIKPARTRGRVPPPSPQTAVWQQDWPLEQGQVLPGWQIRYETYGQPNTQRSNGVLVFHALTGSAHLAGTYTQATLDILSPLEQASGAEGWWDALVGPGRVLDPQRHYVICANHLGSCYGSSGPLDAVAGQAGPQFPALTVRDLAQAQAQLLDHLGLDRVTLIGGSLGGMVALEFAVLFPQRVEQLVVLAAPAVHSAWSRAFNYLSRQAILTDPGYADGYYQTQPRGLELARGVAMLSYRSPQSFLERWANTPERGESYVEYQGNKFARRFDANAYLALSRAMDTHDLGRNRGGVEQALRAVRDLPSLFVGIDSDLLYTAGEVRELAQLANGQYREVRSPHGHDAFLIETDQVERILEGFL